MEEVEEVAFFPPSVQQGVGQQGQDMTMRDWIDQDGRFESKAS